MEDLTILVPRSLVEAYPSLLDPEAGWEFEIEPEVFEAAATGSSTLQKTIGIQQVSVISRQIGDGFEMILPEAWAQSTEV
jgi:hypothetical protein